MKKIIYFILTLTVINPLWAQEEMKTIWEAKLQHHMDFSKGVREAQGLCYGSTEKEITFLDNVTGAQKWTAHYKTVAPHLPRVDELVPLWEAKTIFLFERKLGKDQISCVDMETGKLLWHTNKYQNVSEDNMIYIQELDAFALCLKGVLIMIRARTGEEIWQTNKFIGVIGTYSYMSDGSMILLNYKPLDVGHLFSDFKNQIVKINSKTGELIWNQTYVGSVEKKAITGEPVPKLKIDSGKLFLFMKGLQVYDVNTGSKIWSAAYDIDITELMKKPDGAKRWGLYGFVGEPVIVGNEVFILDMEGKKSQYIKKYDLNTGKLLWTSPELKDVRVVPGLYVRNGKVIVQIGGVIEMQVHILKGELWADGSYVVKEEDRMEHPNIKPWGMEAFDAATGKFLWRSERFKKGITNAFVDNDKIYVCSGKALYSLNVADGKENYEVELSEEHIGLATKILEYKDRIMIVGEKGVSAHKKINGALIIAGKYKSSRLRHVSENTILLQTESADLAAFDMETCKYKKYDARKESMAKLSHDGKFIYVFEKRTITKLAAK